MNGHLVSCGQAFLYYQGQITYQELLLKCYRILFADGMALLQIPRDCQCDSSTGACYTLVLYLFSPPTPNTNTKASALIVGPKRQGCLQHSQALLQNPSYCGPSERQPVFHVTRHTEWRSFYVWCELLPESKRPTRCPGSFLVLEATRCTVCLLFGGDVLGERGLDVNTAAELRSPQLEQAAPWLLLLLRERCKVLAT